MDNRAGSKNLVGFPPLDDLAVLDQLPSADVALTGNGPDGDVLVGVEVKSISDLISSTSTGRLQATQVPAMLNDYDVCWVLVYGDYQASPNGQLVTRKLSYSWVKQWIGRRPVPWSYVEAFLLSLAATGIKVKQVRDVREAALWIGVLAKWWAKPHDKHKSFHTFDHSRDVSMMPGMEEGELLRAKVANCLPGVGHGRAMAVARHFGSVRDMVNAEPSEWEEIDGIGKVIARTVEEAVK